VPNQLIPKAVAKVERNGEQEHCDGLVACGEKNRHNQQQRSDSEGDLPRRILSGKSAFLSLAQ
jgi:hypothetical protein